MANYTANYDLVKPTMAETADIRTINGNMDTIDDIMHASQVSLAPAYDQNETYNTGDIVMYEFLMYECLDDDVTGTWDATKWQRTTASKHGGGGGGSNVSITPTLQSGTKIADFEIDGVSGELYAPSGGGGGGGGNVNGKADLIYRAVDTSFVDIAFDISKYDLYIINASDSLSQSGETYTVTRESLKYYLDNSITFCGWPYRSSSANALIQYIVTANGFEADDHTLGFVITSIYGINTGTILAPMIYSTEEREVGAWVDDKPLYAKSVTTGGTAPTGTTLIQRVEQTDYDTLYYTKDSDIAGSGSYGSLGVPMEHYDDTERVVGTYFGETLYEVSKRGTFSTGTFTALTLSDNIDTLVSYEASIYYPPTNQWLHIPYFEGSDRVYLITNGNLVKMVSNSGMSSYTKFALTIKYTKAST